MRIKKSVVNNHAPCCSMKPFTNCLNRVGYKDTTTATDSGITTKWKTLCSYHRNNILGKSEVAAIKARIGCQNIDGHLGWECNGTHDPDFLTIDHVDGNKHNVSPENIEILCANCHNKKTKISGDTTTGYIYQNTHFDNLFSFYDNQTRH